MKIRHMNGKEVTLSEAIDDAMSKVRLWYMYLHL